MVRSLHRIGFLEDTTYLAGEPEVPKIFELAEVALRAARKAGRP